MKLNIDGIHDLNNKDITSYIQKKIGGLERYIPRSSRSTAHADVRVKEEKIKDKKVCVCEVIVYVPGEVIAAKESTMNMFAAVDIVEEKLKTQIRKYKKKNKDSHYSPIKRILRRFQPSDE